MEDKCSNCHVLRLSTGYRKSGSPESFAVYIVKFQHGSFSMQQDAEGMANSVDSDCSVCPKTLHFYDCGRRPHPAHIVPNKRGKLLYLTVCNKLGLIINRLHQADKHSLKCDMETFYRPGTPVCFYETCNRKYDPSLSILYACFLFPSHLHVAYILLPVSGIKTSLNKYKVEIMDDHHKKRTESTWMLLDRP